MKLASREDLTIIIKTAGWIFFVFAFGAILDDNEIVGYVFQALWLFAILYSVYEHIQYRRGKRPNMIMFPTQNDNSSKFMFVGFGSIVVALSLVGLFTFDIKTSYAIMAMAAGIVIVFMAYLLSPHGWVRIDQNILSTYNNKNPIDVTQLNRVIIKNDTINFLTIYGEIQKSTLLNLDTMIADNIKNFLLTKLGDKISISTHITQTAQ